MKLWVKRGATSVMLRVFIQQNNVTTGVGLTGLTSSSTNLNIAMLRELSSTSEVYSGADLQTIATIGTYAAPTASTNIRFGPVDATNMPGVYELQFHNSANQGFGSGDASRYVTLYIFEITTTSLNLAPLVAEIELVAVDHQDTVRLGLTALPNAAADAAGGLPISDAGGLDLDGRLDALAKRPLHAVRDDGYAALPAGGPKGGADALHALHRFRGQGGQRLRLQRLEQCDRKQ